LTTVGDLLRWNTNFATPKVGDQAFLEEQQTPGHFADGAVHDYGLGLYVRTYKGLREISHSGSTAGYRAFLVRFPDQHLSVSVLCNVSSGQAERHARAVADIYLGDRLRPAPSPSPVTLDARDLDARTGLYRNSETGTVLTIARDGDALRADENTPMTALSPSRFVLGTNRQIEFDGSRVRVTASNGTVSNYERISQATPGTAELRALAGTYVSEEAETTLVVTLHGSALELKRRPDTTLRLTPLYKDAFDSDLGLVRFHRDLAGAVIGLGVTSERVWDLRFARAPIRE
jgi:hypothetical protein